MRAVPRCQLTQEADNMHVDLFEFRKLLTYPSVLTNISVFFVTHTHVTVVRYDTGCYFNVLSNADVSQLNLPHGTNN